MTKWQTWTLVRVDTIYLIQHEWKTAVRDRRMVRLMGFTVLKEQLNRVSWTDLWINDMELIEY